MALMACLLLPALCRADGSDARPMRYKMDYVSGAYLRKSGSTLHFVTADLEWPAWINAGRPQILMNHLAAKLFGNIDFAVADGVDLRVLLDAIDAGKLDAGGVEGADDAVVHLQTLRSEDTADDHTVLQHHLVGIDAAGDKGIV